ncbi:hypothetical protein BBO99_00009532 [Phytophthora kernoviae]|uniref:HECT-type E3 ubiquitin transferase n=2 Tax=Phytophthora kernoviae TaxID=325452 RepID=A0A3R7K8I9_9STRA|nr:hypothetical protein G195_011056 [Phytophthora kernoviae 00238/432]KAG2503552.1 hypothetical protein JM16_009278 [Phytophthora kernoviae]KAG2505789.1 hypothetical protein JM18_009300 [Phytophthora kernoviae]RLN36594.1 hypothetical protein BBI17_009575 [Phytophthora kernoviae]RLN73209.1 hypothetical protein BBO99_00009532 [Phytophthora kernoviae]
MLQNRLAREERHALKLRTAASTKIQALYRRVSAAEHARSAVFTQLEQELTQTVLTGDIQNKPLPTPQLVLFRAIAVGNIVELTALCSFDETLVMIVASVLSEMVTSSLVQWAFDVKHAKYDTTILQEDYDMEEDSEVQQVAPTYLTVGDSTSDEEVRRGSLALGRPYMLSVAAKFTNPPPTLFALLSSMTAEQSLSSGDAPHWDTSLIDSMWQWIQQKIQSIAVQHSSNSLANGPLRYTTSQLQVLLVFNVVYSHMLLGLDDEAFYDRKWPLGLTEVKAVVEFLKQFIYDTCWTITSNNTLSIGDMDKIELVLFSAVVSSVKLFNQLYDRDCRHRFMPEGAWLWPSMHVIKETVDLESMKEDGNHDAHAIYLLMNGKVSSPHARAALILITIPQVLSFNERVQLFQKLLEDEKAQLGGGIRDEFLRALQVRIKRDEIVDNSFEFFQELCDKMSPAALKSRIKVTFINEQGLEEAGIDGGGVFKEYVDTLTKSAFSPEYGFFLATDDQLLYPNPGARYIVDTRKEALDRYRFLGRVLGKAVYENILVEPQFAAFFLNKLLGKFNYIDDLHSLDPELYKSLMRLKHYDGNVEDLALTFSVSEMEFGEVATRNLVPDGANIPVTSENRIRYIHLMANYKLNVLSSMESTAFLKGFRDLIPGTWIQMFAPAELQMLIGGSATNIDAHDWQQHTVYGGGYHPSQRIIQWFWEIVNEFAPEDRAALLKFITSCSRQPLLGFSRLVPQICIHQVRVEDDDRLPSSATCMNLLKLPAYSNKEAMRKKLLYAIRSNAGFDLS